MKKILAFLLTVITVLSITVTAYAENTETYDLIGAATASTSLSISSAGKATASDRYMGGSGEKVLQVTTKIQRKVGLVWVKVDSAEWTVTSTNCLDYSNSHSVNLSQSGTYRSHAVFTILMKNGETKKMTVNSSEKKYTKK